MQFGSFWTWIAIEQTYKAKKDNEWNSLVMGIHQLQQHSGNKS